MQDIAGFVYYALLTKVRVYLSVAMRANFAIDGAGLPVQLASLQAVLPWHSKLVIVLAKPKRVA